VSSKQTDSRGMFQPVHVTTPSARTGSSVRSSAAQFPLDAAYSSRWVTTGQTVSCLVSTSLGLYVEVIK